MRRRLLLTLVAIALVALAAFAVPLAIAERRRVWSDADDAIALDAERIARIAPSDVLGRPGALRLDVGDRDRPTALYDLRGRRVAGTGPEEADLPVRTAITEGQLQVQRVGDAQVAAEPLLDSGRIIGAVRVSTDRHSIERRADQRVVVLAARALAVLVAATAAAYVAAQRVVRPVNALREGAVQIGDGDFTVRVPVSGIPEMDEAADAMNAAAARIGELVERERQFSADVSHQLRAPITGLRTLLESELLAPHSDRATVLHEALDDVDRLEQTVTSLLALTRDTPVDRAVLDVSVVVGALVTARRPDFEVVGRALRIIVEPPDEHPARVSRSALEHVMAVLLDNALLHGAGTATVTVSTTGDGAVVVTVQDEGPGVDEPDRVFRRRVSAARPGGGHGTGHGIGLALAATLAHAEGGRLSLDAPGPNPRFRLLLPHRRAADASTARPRADRATAR